MFFLSHAAENDVGLDSTPPPLGPTSKPDLVLFQQTGASSALKKKKKKPERDSKDEAEVINFVLIKESRGDRIDSRIQWQRCVALIDVLGMVCSTRSNVKE